MMESALTGHNKCQLAQICVNCTNRGESASDGKLVQFNITGKIGFEFILMSFI